MLSFSCWINVIVYRNSKMESKKREMENWRIEERRGEVFPTLRSSFSSATFGINGGTPDTVIRVKRNGQQRHLDKSVPHENAAPDQLLHARFRI